MNSIMDRSDLKKLAAYGAVIAIMFVAYYGNFLPLRKSQSFIYMNRSLGTVRSWEQLQVIASESLDKRSPIGQEEIVRSFTNMMLGVLRSNGQNPALTAAVMEYLHRYYDPIINRGRGMSFQQNLYVLGLMNQIAYAQTKEAAYLNESERYFVTAVNLAPNRPQSLYGLLDVYRIKQDRQKMEEIGNRILSLWPQDENVKALLQGK
jgi:hypothetical protein